MTAQNCLEMLREIKDVAFATVGETGLDRKSTRLNSSHSRATRMPSSA